jgi:glycerate 2-kinase
MEIAELRSALSTIFTAALDAVDPERAVLEYLKAHPIEAGHHRRIYLGGIGKAAAPMARAVETSLEGRVRAGLLIVKDGHGGRLKKIEVLEASHPQPDARGERAARRLTRFLAENLTADDLLVFLISGGGSALLPLPVSALTLEDKQRVTAVLIRCGADIQEINTIRKHLSQVKGGRLLDFTNGARVLSLVLSDVIGDDFASIASGPTAGDPTTFSDCLEIIQKYGIADELPAAALDYLRRGAAGGPDGVAETPKPGDLRFQTVENVLVANNFSALENAAEAARRVGLAPLILSSSIDGNTNDIARMHVALAREVLASGHPLPPPCCLISAGETTVQLRGDGKGGRNMEFVLQCAHEIRHWPDRPVLFCSLGSDGNDGPTDAAGAAASFETLRKARENGLDTADFLRRNDSYHFFEPLGDLIVTGPTRTNVMDLRFVLVGGK